MSSAELLQHDFLPEKIGVQPKRATGSNYGNFIFQTERFKNSPLAHMLYKWLEQQLLWFRVHDSVCGRYHNNLAFTIHPPPPPQ